MRQMKFQLTSFGAKVFRNIRSHEHLTLQAIDKYKI